MFPSPLLVLAFVGVCAADIHPGPFDKCTVEFLGSKIGRSSFPVPMPVIRTTDGILDIPDVCGKLGLAGVHVEVCDDDVAPKLKMPMWPQYTPVEVLRYGKWKTPARVIVNEFCKLPEHGQ